MKKNRKLLDAIDDFTLSMEHLREFIHLGEIAALRNKLRNPDYFFADLNEKMQAVKSKQDAMLNLI